MLRHTFNFGALLAIQSLAIDIESLSENGTEASSCICTSQYSPVTCDDGVEYGNQCKATCAGQSSSSCTSSIFNDLQALIDSIEGGDADDADDDADDAEVFTATSTRYWDCSGGACGCGFGDSDLPTHCHSNALFEAPDGNEYGANFYGGAAISTALGGDYWMGEGCGKCFKVTAESNVTGYSGSKTVVLKGTNYCPDSNSVCANGAKHFDIAAPGFDWTGTSDHNTCDDVETDTALHSPQNCMYWMVTSQDPDDNCDCTFEDPVLTAGCENFRALGWNNPTVQYQEVDCPAELELAAGCPTTSVFQGWPSTSAGYCADPFYSA